MKHHFKGPLVRHLPAKIDQQDKDLQISLLYALYFIAVSWDRVTQSTTANCFHNYGFLNPTVVASLELEEDNSDIEVGATWH